VLPTWRCRLQSHRFDTVELFMQVSNFGSHEIIAWRGVFLEELIMTAVACNSPRFFETKSLQEPALEPVLRRVFPS